jgi:nitrate reductase cytochrome c-type subunit
MKSHGLLLCLLLPIGGFAQTGSPTSSACAQCHVEALTQPGTYMAHALETVGKSKILIDHPLLTTTVGQYSYRIERKGTESQYSVTDGTATVTMPIRWAMGASSAIGQTFILEKDGELYESRVSWFRELEGLGPTMGSAGSTPADITAAAGRLMSGDDKRRCFGCHATHAVEGKQLTLEKLTPGVQCGHCHQGIDAHLAAMTAGNPAAAPPPPDLHKLIGLSADQASNFCGQCHRTWQEIALQGNPSIANVRFQPYRLTGSKCYDPDDARISCLACHNPHHDFGPQPVNFDPKCLACHGSAKAASARPVTAKPGAKACPVAKSNCVSCHMPKLDLPGAHFKFTDHRIRIVKPNEPYPG